MTILDLCDQSAQQAAAAAWFHEKWGVPQAAYLESMAQSRAGAPVPRWYLALDGAAIAGGLGVIDNDFHPRRDLTPNICAVYVEEPYRNRGLAGALLRRACGDLARLGVGTVYLLTDHTGFYERYGWRYLCDVLGDGAQGPSRVYVHREEA